MFHRKCLCMQLTQHFINSNLNDLSKLIFSYEKWNLREPEEQRCIFWKQITHDIWQRRKKEYANKDKDIISTVLKYFNYISNQKLIITYWFITYVDWNVHLSFECSLWMIKYIPTSAHMKMWRPILSTSRWQYIQFKQM